jgi:hypothetical protein
MVYIDETISVADGIIYSIMYTYIYIDRVTQIDWKGVELCPTFWSKIMPREEHINVNVYIWEMITLC